MNHRLLPFLLAGLFSITPSVEAGVVFFRNQFQSLRASNLRLAEKKVPIYHRRKLIRRQKHEAVEGFFRVGRRNSYPQLFADLAANGYFRLTYQKRNGRSGRLGTSIATSPSYRTNQTLDLVPDIQRTTVYAKGTGTTYRSKIRASFGGDASLILEKRLEGVRVNRSRFELQSRIATLTDLALSRDTAVVGNDRFRVITFSSMFADRDRYDADLIRYEALGGETVTLQLRNTTPRDAHLFASPQLVGSWVELVKTRGSTWNPDSPSIRIEIKNRGGLRLGVQGCLDGSPDPNDDSLSVWLEWIDAPESVPAGTVHDFEFEVIATPPL